MISLRSTLALSLALTLAFASIASYELFRYREQMRHNDAQQKLINQINTSALQLIVVGVDYTQKPSLRSLRQWDNVITQTKQQLAEIEQLGNGEVDRVRGHNLSDIHRLTTLTERQMAVFREANVNGALSPAQLITSLHLLANVAHKEWLEIVQHTQEQREQAFAAVLLVMVSVLVVFVVGCIMILRLVTLPLNQLQQDLNRIAHHDMETNISIGGFTELRSVGESADNMRLELFATTVSRDDMREEIEERKKVEQQNLTLISRLEQTQQQVVSMEKQSTVGSLVGGVAHEINNPLMGCLSYIDYCTNNTTQPEIKEVLQKVNLLLERLQRTTRSLLMFARKKSPEQSSYCSTDSVIPRVCELFATQLRGSPIRFSYPQDTPAFCIGISEDHLEQTILNLLINASHAVEGCESPSIRLSYEKVGQELQVSISDNGVGIEDAVKYRIFDPFFTTKAPEKSSGLGLSTCKQYVSEAGGEIRLESSPGEGTTFTLGFDLRERND